MKKQLLLILAVLLIAILVGAVLEGFGIASLDRFLLILVYVELLKIDYDNFMKNEKGE